MGRLHGGAGTTGWSKVSDSHIRRTTALRLSRARPCHQNASTGKLGTKSQAWGTRKDRAQHLRAGSTLHKSIVQQAATTAWTRGICSSTASSPHDTLLCFYMSLAISETAKLPVPNGQMAEEESTKTRACLGEEGAQQRSTYSAPPVEHPLFFRRPSKQAPKQAGACVLAISTATCACACVLAC